MSAPTERSRPARLFKYQPGSCNAFEGLRSRTLWFSAPARFNDPFDCAISFIGRPSPEELDALIADYLKAHPPDDPRQPDETLRTRFPRALEAAIDYVFSGRAFDEIRGIACLAESPTDLLMWSHYADGHHGFCMEFDATVDPFAIALPVRYPAEPPELSLVRCILEDDPTTFDAMMDAMLLTKAKCWEYEREWRILHAEPNFAAPYPGDALIAVHCGAAMSEKHVEAITSILAGSGTQVLRARRHRKAFAVTTEPDEADEFRALARRLWGPEPTPQERSPAAGSGDSEELRSPRG